jgi:hypothetical protein
MMKNQNPISRSSVTFQEWAEKNGIQSALECPVNPPDEEKPDA